MTVGQGIAGAGNCQTPRISEIAGAVAYRAESWHVGGSFENAARASILWFTAREDNLPQRLLTAAASGTVIVSTDVGGIPELLRQRGQC